MFSETATFFFKSLVFLMTTSLLTWKNGRFFLVLMPFNDTSTLQIWFLDHWLDLKSYVSGEILFCFSRSADLCIHFYWLSLVRQAINRKIIQSIVIRLFKYHSAVAATSLASHRHCYCNVLFCKIKARQSYFSEPGGSDVALQSFQISLNNKTLRTTFQIDHAFET